jgi:hypothetical protein
MGESRERLIFCAACSEPVSKVDGVWWHDDADVHAVCDADRIIPLEGFRAFSPRPYDPRETLRALARKDGQETR